MCIGCPNGYSGIGGQTLNPYGPRKFDTGGSSSGSAVAVASNFAVAAIGTETSGSILSPSSQNSVVGLKPGFGILNKEGIIPISSTLDTPGPITKNTIDNAIVFASMKTDFSKKSQQIMELNETSHLRLGVIKTFLQDETFGRTLKALEEKDIQLVEIEPTPMNFSGFLELLSGEMKTDLEAYFKTYGERKLTLAGIEDVMNFNSKDSLTNIPYNQGLFDGIINLNIEEKELNEIRLNLLSQGKLYFDEIFEAETLDVVISMNNYSAGQAALAGYPAITVPMGYNAKGEPRGITFIGKANTDEKLLAIAHFFETHFPKRVPPKL
jgi:amidase